jgi:peptidoglycan/LPS O-acetylase OafA/YrhL
MAGSLLALMTRSKSFTSSRYLTLAWITLLVMAPLAVFIDNFNARWIVFSLVAFASLSFVYLALFSQQRQLQALLRSRVLVYTGTISYGIYLLSKLPVDAVKLAHLERFPLLAFPITLVVTYALAALSWKVLERPFLRLKRSFESPRTPESRTPDEIAEAM